VPEGDRPQRYHQEKRDRHRGKEGCERWLGSQQGTTADGSKAADKCPHLPAGEPGCRRKLRRPRRQPPNGLVQPLVGIESLGGVRHAFLRLGCDLRRRRAIGARDAQVAILSCGAGTLHGQTPPPGGSKLMILP
jgi:hypothetical protein